MKRITVFAEAIARRSASPPASGVPARRAAARLALEERIPPRTKGARPRLRRTCEACDLKAPL